MKTFFSFFLFISLLPPCSFSQEQLSKKANKEYSDYDYSQAARHFEKFRKDDAALRSLADSYYKTQQYAQSEQVCLWLASSPSPTSQDMVNYIQVLLVNEKYNEAMTWMAKYSALYPLDSRYNSYLSNNNLIEKLKTDSKQFLIKNLEINSEQEDFGAVFFKDNVIFASSRPNSNAVKRIWNGNKLPYLDLYLSGVDTKGEFKKPVPFYKAVNKKYNEGPATFTKNGETMAFTRNNYESKSPDGVCRLQVFTSTLKNNTASAGKSSYNWTTPVGVPFNNNEYSVGHPAFNDKGTIMYFASDMPGGKGGTDLYKVSLLPDGTWGKPQNLGDKINTAGDEMFPFFHSSGMLFFSSTGHEGLGGLDVFVAQLKDGEIEQVKNVGSPINSSKDDFSFILNEAMSGGYFASNRQGGKGNDDIYSYQLLKPFHFEKVITGTTKNKEGALLAHANVVLKDENGKEIKSTLSDIYGKFIFEINGEKPASISGSLKNYIDTRIRMNSQTANVDLVLEEAPPFSLACSLSDKKTTLPLQGAKISLSDNTRGKKIISFQTDSSGFTRIPITGKNVEDQYSYLIKIEKEGYLSKSVTLNGVIKPGEIKMTETLEKIEIGTDLGKVLNIKPIYFDQGKWDIRPDATTELDKIIKVMNENPGMIIELGSHTDCRGTASSNLFLSDKRAKSSAEYVKKKISNPSRIYGKGYGESLPVNNCRCEGLLKSNCSEEEYQKNRRTEFKIVKM